MFYEALALAIASSYIFAIYAFQPVRLKYKSRDDLEVMQFRFYRVGMLSFILLALVPYLVQGEFVENIKFMGLIPGFTSNMNLQEDIKGIGYSAMFIVILFSSSIFQMLETDGDDEDDENVNERDGNQNERSFWYRDLVFAPITEELIYRGIVLLVVRKQIPNFLKFTPFLFGIAHVHHGWQLYCKRVALLQILISISFQFAYTSLFGYLSNWIYLKTQNLWAPIIVHLGCNYFGFPSFSISSDLLALRVVYFFLIFLGAGFALREYSAS